MTRASGIEFAGMKSFWVFDVMGAVEVSLVINVTGKDSLGLL